MNHINPLRRGYQPEVGRKGKGPMGKRQYMKTKKINKLTKTTITKQPSFDGRNRI